MFTKSLIAGSAMVLALGIGSAVAAEPVEKTTIMPQGVQAMAAAELETVRGTWWPLNDIAIAASGGRILVVHNGGDGAPRGLTAKNPYGPPGQD